MEQQAQIQNKAWRCRGTKVASVAK